MTSDMTAPKAKALRAEFPASAIGKLPKPYKADSQRGNCPECRGYHGLPAVHLDYVGHAATTARLLEVDPEWTWRPFTVEEIQCLPPKLREAGLWIHLTVCGVTRPGVGDGKSAKECIGDAIRNGAMRFGVALDLWAKEDLHEISAQQSPEAESEPPPVEPAGPKMQPATRSHLFALFSRKGVAEADQLPGINHITGAGYTSRADITEAHAKEVIAVLKSRPDAEAAS